MTTYTETIGKRLNDLLEKTYDAEKGFKKAAENTEHTYLKNYFTRKSQERYNFGHELKAEIKSFGEDIEKEGSFAGTIHRGWMDIKAVFSSDNDEAMLEEAIRGERTALDEYNDILAETSLPFNTRQVLVRHRDTIAKDLNTIKRLEDIK